MLPEYLWWFVKPVQGASKVRSKDPDPEESSRKNRSKITQSSTTKRDIESQAILRQNRSMATLSLTDEQVVELVKQLGRQFPEVALIILSMHDEALYAERALRAGVRGYVMKHETSKCVLASIRRVLGGGFYVSERIVNRIALRVTSSCEQVAGSPVERLSDRELEIFRLLGKGRTTSQIAADLNLSLKTVQAYCARAKEKFGVTSLTELLRAAIRWDDASQVK